MPCVRNGRVYGKQRYRCKTCKRSFVEEYTYNRYVDRLIPALVKVGLGIRGIAQALEISSHTVIKRIVEAADAIDKPPVVSRRAFEIDELHTYIGNKKDKVWIIYTIDRDTREVIDFTVGGTCEHSMKPVIRTVLDHGPFRVYTDKHRTYAMLLPKNIHRTYNGCTNRIERKNLSLRTHLKRLGSDTICYSKSLVLLMSCLKIYFWG